MTVKKFRLLADVRSADREKLRASLKDLLPSAKVEETDFGFKVQANLQGDSAKDLNRALLSRLRQVERKTTMRSEWRSTEGTERFFDYVLKNRSTKSR